MPNAAWQEFRSTLPLDNGLLAAAIAAGEPPEHAEILSLAAAVQAIYLSVTLEARELGRIDACYALWHETAGLFTDLCSAWTREPAHPDPDIQWLKSRLEHFQSLALDRVELYAVSQADRRQFAEIKDLGFANNPSSPQPPASRHRWRVKRAVS